RPGGVVVYSVCSFEPEETEAVVERFLRQSPSMVLESATGVLPNSVVDAQGFMSVLPHVHGCDGAFAARFRRILAAPPPSTPGRSGGAPRVQPPPRFRRIQPGPRSRNRTTPPPEVQRPAGGSRRSLRWRGSRWRRSSPACSCSTTS